MMRIWLLLVVALCAINLSYAQTGNGTDTSIGASRITSSITADSLASGNYKDVLTSFFQLALNDLTGPTKGVSFASNPYAIMTKANPNLAIDTDYVRYRHLRDLNFNVSVLFDSAYHLNGFSFGVKYALINGRDNTISKDFVRRVINDESDLDKLHRYFSEVISDKSRDRGFRSKFADQASKWQKDTTGTIAFDSLDKDVQDAMYDLMKKHGLFSLQVFIEHNPDLNFRKENQKSFQDLVSQWQQRPLWTIAANSTFKPNSFAASGANNLSANNIFVSSEFLLGINTPKSKINLELNLIATDSFANNNTLNQENLSRHSFSFEPGVNFVIKSKDVGKSLFEFKLSGTYYHIFSKPSPSENVNSSTINGIVRFRIINDIWVPITLKMDDNGHVFGSLDLKFNFTTLASILKK